MLGAVALKFVPATDMVRLPETFPGRAGGSYPVHIVDRGVIGQWFRWVEKMIGEGFLFVFNQRQLSGFEIGEVVAGILFGAAENQYSEWRASPKLDQHG